MPSDLAALAIIAMVAGITFASRLSGSVLMSRVVISPRVERFLDHLSTSVIAAMVASIVAQNGLREAFAIALAGVIVLKTRSAFWAMIGGMALAAAWSLFGST